MLGIYQRGRRVLFARPNLKDWEDGVTIICKRCGNVQIVKEKSLCDLWKLCSTCARQDIENGRLKVIYRRT